MKANDHTRLAADTMYRDGGYRWLTVEFASQLCHNLRNGTYNDGDAMLRLGAQSLAFAGVERLPTYSFVALLVT